LKKNLNLNLGSTDALIITDIQNDFLPGGALPVKEGDLVIPVLNEYAKIFHKANAKIVASRDWHPANHVSFTSQGGPWPPHCVQDTEGARFSPNLKLPVSTEIISKATNPQKEAYSVFDSTGLGDRLKSGGVTRVFIGGLATDYCIVNSVLDARQMKLEVIVLADAIRGINLNQGDVDKALDTINQSGAIMLALGDFPEPEPLTGVESPADVEGDKPIVNHFVKKKARMRSRGSYKQVRRERG
jgi:nicotinamidase/pyrazinamidase